MHFGGRRAPSARSTVSLPSHAYFDSQWAARESERLWPRVWHLAAWSGDLEAPGSRAVYTCGRDRALLVRKSDGELRAYEDSCPHRGSLLTDASVDAGPLPSRAGECSLECPSHGWRFDDEGRVRDARGYGSSTKGLGLRALACEERHGFVWVHFAGKNTALARFLGAELEALFARYDTAGHALVGDYTLSLACNWKVAVDATVETLHASAVHPELSEYVRERESEVMLFARHSTQRVPFALPASNEVASSDALAALVRKSGLDPSSVSPYEVRGLLQRHKRAQVTHYPYARLSDDELVDDTHVALFPHVALNLFAETRTLFRARPDPHDPARCRWDVQFYRVLSVAERARWQRPPRVAVAHADPARLPLEPASARRVLAQDAAFFERVQAGLYARGFEGPRPGPRESRVRHFHEHLQRALRRV